MQVAGKKVSRVRWVHTPCYVVRVEVEAIIPDADPDQACYLPETVKFLREVEARAHRGDVAWLHRHGRVYRAMDAA